MELTTIPRWTNRRELLDDCIAAGDTTAESGVDRGAFSREMLARNPRRHFAVDPYVDLHPGGIWQAGRLVGWRERFLDAHQQFATDARVAFVRATSANFWRTCQPGEFDMVYLDGSHVLDAVRLDLRGAWRAVRPGGWITGHDWCDDIRVLPGVRVAVSEFAVAARVPVYLTDEPAVDPVWFAERLADFTVAYRSYAIRRDERDSPFPQT